MKKLRISVLCAIIAIGASPLSGEEPAPGKQVEQELAAGDKKVPYLLYLPEGYKEKEKWPLMLFLHGRGESHGPLSIVKKWGPPRQVDMGHDLPYIIVSPQCPSEDSWPRQSQQELLLKLLDHIEAEYKTDPSRVYLTGLSMGAYGSWRLAADHPERFAAVAPICGAGRPEDAEKLKNLPIWVWHGTEDRAVPFSRSEEMVEAIQEAGGTKIRFTTLEHVGHNSWEAAYSTPELYQWMDRQPPAARPAE